MVFSLCLSCQGPPLTSTYLSISTYLYLLVYPAFGLETRQHRISIYLFMYLLVYPAFGLETRQHRISIYIYIDIYIHIYIYVSTCSSCVRLGNSPTQDKRIHIFIYLSSLCGVRLGNSPTPHKHIHIVVYGAFGLETRQHPINIYKYIRRTAPHSTECSPIFFPQCRGHARR